MATTTNYSWTTPDNTAYVKDGASAIRTLGSSVDTTLYTALGGAYPGLRLIKKQTIGSAVSSVAVTSAFSATYDNYKIIVSGGVASGATDLTLSLTGGTSVYSYGILYVAYGTSTPAAVTATNAASFVFAGNATGDTLDMNCDIKDPFNARYTTFKSQNASNTLSGASTAIHKAGSSFTGFTITPAAGTLTGGTIFVYGYGVS